MSVRQHSSCPFDYFSFLLNLCPNFPNKAKISFSKRSGVAAPLPLPLVAEGLHLGIGTGLLDFGSLSTSPSDLCSSHPLCPQNHPNCSTLQQKSTRALHYGSRNKVGFLSRSARFSCLFGGKSSIFLCKPFGEIGCKKSSGLKALVYVLTLGALFTALLFLPLMSERRIFVAVSTGVCCAQTDPAALPASKRRRSDSGLISFD